MRQRLEDPDPALVAAALTVGVKLMEVCCSIRHTFRRLTLPTGRNHVKGTVSPNIAEAIARYLEGMPDERLYRASHQGDSGITGREVRLIVLACVASPD